MTLERLADPAALADATFRHMRESPTPVVACRHFWSDLETLRRLGAGRRELLAFIDRVVELLPPGPAARAAPVRFGSRGAMRGLKTIAEARGLIERFRQDGGGADLTARRSGAVREVVLLGRRMVEELEGLE